MTEAMSTGALLEVLFDLGTKAKKSSSIHAVNAYTCVGDCEQSVS